MIKINWMALLEVSVVTFVGTMIVVGIVSLAAALLDKGHIAAAAGEVESPYHSRYALVSFVLFGVVLAIIAFGFYLLIPWWH